MFHLETTHDLDCFLSDRELWNRLAGGVPFRQAQWLGPWWRQFGSGKQPLVLVARDDQGAICGLLPLYRQHTGTPGRTLAMIGDGQACSDHVSVLAAPEQACEIALAMGSHLASIASDPQDGWDLIDIDGVVEGDRPMEALARGLKSGGAVLHAQSRMSVWFKPKDESWDEHLKHYGKTQRRKMRRMRETLEQSGRVEKVVAESTSDVDTLLTALIEMHQTRWETAGQPGSYREDSFRRFVFETANEFLATGNLYLAALRHEGRIMGAELNFVGDNRISYSYSAGYDIEASELEPGRLLAIDTLLQLYREDLVGVDYMRGDEEYKRRFSTTSRKLLRLRAVAPTWLPRLRHVAWNTQFELTQWVRRRTGRRPIDVLELG